MRASRVVVSDWKRTDCPLAVKRITYGQPTGTDALQTVVIDRMAGEERSLAGRLPFDPLMRSRIGDQCQNCVQVVRLAQHHGLDALGEPEKETRDARR